jgi:hypothetical protein
MGAAEDTGEDWQFRAYDPDLDEGGMMYLLGVSYSRGRAGWRAGASGAGETRQGSTPDQAVVDRQKAFLDTHAPIWRWLLANADVRLAVDPMKPDTDIWGWIITSEPNVIHALGVKRSVIKAGLGKELVLDLARDRWREHQVVTLELPQLRQATSTYKSSHIVDVNRPHEWSLDPSWLLTRMAR